MKRKVANQDLEVGMYVVEIDRPWVQAPFEPPFDLQGFKIRTDEELDKIQKLCRYVYIDPNLGAEAKRYLKDERNLRDLAAVISELPASSAPLQVYEEQTSIKREVHTARQVLKDTHSLYTKVVSDLHGGREVDAAEIENVVTSLVESVIRNPAALSWLVGLKNKDENTYTHAISVAVLSLAMGRYLGLPKERLEVLGTSALLQDVGKMSVPRELLSKTTRLTFEERKVLKHHVDVSVEMLRSVRNFSIEVIRTAGMHHERYDGSGYPQGLSGNDIPVLTTINGLVDCYQAAICERPYRRAKTSFNALMELYAERETAFPAGIVEQFIQCVGIFPIGSFVQLNTREIGVVVQRNQIQQLKPKVMILINHKGQRLEEPETVDLAAQYLQPGKPARLISKVINPEKHELDSSEFFA